MYRQIRRVYRGVAAAFTVLDKSAILCGADALELLDAGAGKMRQGKTETGQRSLASDLLEAIGTGNRVHFDGFDCRKTFESLASNLRHGGGTCCCTAGCGSPLISLG